MEPLGSSYGTLREPLWNAYGALMEPLWSPCGALMQPLWSLMWPLRALSRQQTSNAASLTDSREGANIRRLQAFSSALKGPLRALEVP